MTKVNVKQKMKMIAFNLIPKSESLYGPHKLSSVSEPLTDEGGQFRKDYQAPICAHILVLWLSRRKGKDIELEFLVSKNTFTQLRTERIHRTI